MRIRERYAIRDRIKVIVILLSLLIFCVNLACLVSQNSQTEKLATIEKLLQTALKPVGSTMYIWGGGWDGEDSGSGEVSTRIGLNPQWKTFAQQQDEAYDFKEHRYERENGLDCSGFVGWVLYNTFEKEKGQAGYVTTSTDFAESLAGRGWGRLIKNPRGFVPGDIVSMEGHVWICLGVCEDGSVLLVHSSPPGVSVCGTPIPKYDVATEEKKTQDSLSQSMAVTLATEYMGKHVPQWQEKYPNRSVSSSYIKNVTVFRWNESIMSDAKEMQGLSAEEIMEILDRIR